MSKSGCCQLLRIRYQDMPEAPSMEVVARLLRCQRNPQTCGNFGRRDRIRLFLLTDVVSCELAEVALRKLTELIVAVALLADYKFSAVVARVEPFGVGSLAAAGAIESNARPQLDERTALL